MSKANRYIIVHCSDSLWGNREVIEEWHRARGFTAIGYNWVILNQYPTYNDLKYKRSQDTDGLLVKGRDIDRDGDVDEEVGAHALGYNGNSIGICVIGKKGSFTEKQMRTLYATLFAKCLEFNIPVENILGHCETAQAGGKTCPDMDMNHVRVEVATLLNSTRRVTS